ncbi:NUDIX hydrolase [Vicingaceae bacterium]|nr:NUDIX hydrolase [Vicingaceae bacterium]MDB9963655.1 NUDIX hydrolase [Vicingaceae bacterium]MDC0004825.1 NUDIX hydrolase [bacterium]
MDLKRYNIRVYGLLINGKDEVLLSKEFRFGKRFVKFPGGGHELGEGILDGLKREFREELGIEIQSAQHFYTTDFLQVSAFATDEQLISVYYKVTSNKAEFIRQSQQSLDIVEGDEHTFLWKSVAELSEQDVTYPIDKLVVKMMKEVI